MAVTHAEARRDPAPVRRPPSPTSAPRAMPASPQPNVARALQQRLGNEGTHAALRLQLDGGQETRAAESAPLSSAPPPRAPATQAGPSPVVPTAAETRPPGAATVAQPVDKSPAPPAPVRPAIAAPRAAPRPSRPAPADEATREGDGVVGTFEALAQTAVSRFAATVAKAQAATPGIQAHEKRDLAESLPRIERPTGLPRGGQHRRAPPTILPPAAAPDMPTAAGARQAQSANGRESVDRGALLATGTGALTAEPAAEEEGSWWDWLVGRIQQFFAAIPTTDPGLSTSAGPRPMVDLAGEANPGRIEVHRAISGQAVSDRHAAADAATSADFGENDIYPTVPGGTVGSSYAPSAPPAQGGSGVPAPPALPPDVRTSFDLHARRLVSEKVGAGGTRYSQAEDKHRQQSQQAREDAQRQLDEASEQARTEQQTVQQQARGEVEGARRRWGAENQDIEQRFATQADAKRAETDRQIDAKTREGDDKAARILSDAETKADEQRATAEKRAVDAKREAESRPRSWWDRVKGAINSVFDGIRRTINGIFDAARWAVKKLIEGAKAVAHALIETIRLAVVGLVYAFGAVLKGLATVALIAFPQTAARWCHWIDEKVDGAISAVNDAADWLKKKYDELYDWLGRTLDAILSFLQTVWNLELEILRLLATGEFDKAMEILATLVGAAWDSLNFVEGEVEHELIGFDLTRDLGPQLMGEAEEDGNVEAQRDVGGGDRANIAFLLQDRIRDDQVEVSPVPEVELDSPLREQLDLDEGQTRVLGTTNDPQRGADAAIQDLLEPLAEPESATDATSASKSNDPVDQEMAQVDPSMLVVLARAKTAKTRTERLAVVRDLMLAGLKKWWHDLPAWKIAAAAVGAVVAVVIVVLSGGTGAALLAVVAEAVAGAMIAADVARMSSHLSAYVEHAMAGKRTPAAHAFARGLAVGISMLVMLALAELLGQALKLAGKLFARAARVAVRAAKAAGKAVVAGVRFAARALIDGILYIGKLVIRAAKIVARIVARGGRYVLERGKLIFEGIQSTFAKGAKTLRELYERLFTWFRRFKGFSLEVKGRWITLYAILNPEKIPIIRIPRPRTLLGLEIPPAGSKEFVVWFDQLSFTDFMKYWQDIKTEKLIGAREIIERNIRHPGGLHEWLKVSQTPKLKQWGVSMETIRDARTPTAEMAKKGFPHGSQLLHREIDALFASTSSYEDFLAKLNKWADVRLTKGRLDLPPVLQR